MLEIIAQQAREPQLDCSGQVHTAAPLNPASVASGDVRPQPSERGGGIPAESEAGAAGRAFKRSGKAMEFRNARAEDFTGILELQEANFIDTLSPEERKGGYLSARFSLAQIAAIADDLAIVVALEERRVVGYMCASRREFASGSPIVEMMLRSLGPLRFNGKALENTALCIYGPVCIAAAHRGRGVLRRLFARLKQELGGRFEAGAAFIAADNPHSLRAHVDGLGMQRIGEFAVNAKRYAIVAFEL